MDALGFDLASDAEEIDGTMDSSWIAESGAEAGWGCTKAQGVRVGGVLIRYKRLAWDAATICGV